MTNIYNLTEGTLNQIQSYDRVVGMIIMNNDGTIIESTLDNSDTVKYTDLVQQVIRTSKKIKKHDTSDDLFLTFYTTKYDILIWEKEFVMIVLQNSRHKTTDIKCI